MSELGYRIHRSIGRGWSVFYRLLGRLLGASKTRLTAPRFDLTSTLLFLHQQRLFSRISRLDGDIVECGVGRGRTLLFWSMLCYGEGRQRPLWGFDSFEGFPEPAREDESPRQAKKGEWDVTSIESITEMLASTGLDQHWIQTQLTLVKGFFDASLSKFTGERIALLHIDADLYQSYKTVLESLYDRVVRGGVIALDEYMTTSDDQKFPGARRAVDEFMAARRIKARLRRDRSTGKYYFIKP